MVALLFGSFSSAAIAIDKFHQLEKINLWNKCKKIICYQYGSLINLLAGEKNVCVGAYKMFTKKKIKKVNKNFFKFTYMISVFVCIILNYVNIYSFIESNRKWLHWTWLKYTLSG